MPSSHFRIGLIIDSIGAYGRGVLRGVTAYAQAHPHWSILVQPRWSFEQPVRRPRRIDGLIVQVHSRAFEQRVRGWAVPTTNVSNMLVPVQLPTVIPDDAAVGRMASDYFQGRGFTDWGFYGPIDAGFSRLRYESMHRSAAKAGARMHFLNARRGNAISWLRRLPKPVAVLAANDDWAHRLLADCRRANLVVPDEVAILGVDNDDLFNALASPSLSSVALPTERIGLEAAGLLDQILQGHRPAAAPRLLPPLGVVTRRSTDVLAIPDEKVAAAARFIRDHADRPIQVADVLGSAPLSRRSLERGFRTLLGRSVADEIRRVHVARARHLLLTTDMTMAQIAGACGLTGATRLGIVFRRETGLPPRRYRLTYRSQA